MTYSKWQVNLTNFLQRISSLSQLTKGHKNVWHDLSRLRPKSNSNMVPPYHFYQGFMLDFFILKQATYKNILDNFEQLEPLVLRDVSDYSKDDYKKTLRASIRQTYFHSIETLFELIFAIETGIRVSPDHHQDELTLLRLVRSQSQINFKRIENLASKDPDELQLWTKKYKLNSIDQELSMIQYIFYYITNRSNTSIDHPEYWDLLDSSLQCIENSLGLFAKDFSDRTEYNAYKHGLRILPLLKGFTTLNSETAQTVHFDFSDSITYMTEKDNQIKYTTKVFDTERDFQMTVLVSYFISNITNARKGVFFDQAKLLRFFHPDEVSKLSKVNVKAREMVETYTYEKSIKSSLP